MSTIARLALWQGYMDKTADNPLSAMTDEFHREKMVPTGATNPVYRISDNTDDQPLNLTPSDATDERTPLNPFGLNGVDEEAKFGEDIGLPRRDAVALAQQQKTEPKRSGSADSAETVDSATNDTGIDANGKDKMNRTQPSKLDMIRALMAANPKTTGTIGGAAVGGAVGGALSRKNRLMGVLLGSTVGGAGGYAAGRAYENIG